MTKTSVANFEAAKQLIPGGVNSPVRAFKAVGGSPVYFDHAQGAYLTDVDGKTYIDYVGSWGPMILGHNNPEVVEAICEQVRKAISFGSPTTFETDLAHLVTQIMPNIERIRFVNSGTEATMSAIRLARGFTGRDKIVKFNGCYHGHADHLLVKAGSGLLTFGIPGSPGVPADFVQHTHTLEFNDVDQFNALFDQSGDEIAAVILEPFVGNMNLVRPSESFIQALRARCTEHGAVLIFDEVMTGFRVARGGAQALLGVQPDLTTLGKVIGGGMPVGAFGGRADIMSHLAPEGPVYQAGTLSGNPVAMAGGLATLRAIQRDPAFYDKLGQMTRKLVAGLNAAAAEFDYPFFADSVGGMFGLYFTDNRSVTSFQDIANSNIEAFNAFYHHMLAAGIYFGPSAYEAAFMSIAHTETDIEKTIAAAHGFFEKMTVEQKDAVAELA